MGFEELCPAICADAPNVDLLPALNKLVHAHVTPLQLPGGYTLIQQECVPDHMYYVHHGRIISYEHNDTGQALTSLWKSDDIILPRTFLDRTPSSETIQSLTACKLSALSYQAICDIIATNTEAANMFHLLLNRMLNDAFQKITDLKQKTALDRYNDFIHHYRGIEHFLPQKQIAVLLGIKPQSLSRIRRALQLKEKLRSVCAAATENTF